MKKIIIICIFIIVLFSQNSLAKYYSKTNIQVSAEILEPIVEVENNNMVTIKSDESRTYEFKIKNFNVEEKINELCLEYYMEFSENDNEIFSIKLYKNNEQISVKNNKTEKFLLNNNEKQEDDYKIEILFKDISEKEIYENIKMIIYFETKNI